MLSFLPSRIRASAASAALVLAASATAAPAAAHSTGSGTDTGSGTKPTIVLVHGAFSDPSAWRGVMERLQRSGHPVVAPPNDLRNLSQDSAHLASFLDTVEGPIVLVGHSYGGAVVTNAAAADPDVKALVYIAAMALDEGESAEEMNERFPGSSLTRTALAPVPYPLPGGGTGIEFYVKPDEFRQALVADIPVRTADVMAASQRPVATAALTGESRAPAWKTIPSWYLVPTRDRAIAPAAERFMAERAGSRTVEVDAPHFAMVTHPEAVTRLILDAATGRTTPTGATLADTGASDRTRVALGAAAAVAVTTGTALLLAARRRTSRLRTESENAR
ncbi:alpha/beta fold hydrolase [Streptomyces marokkonensis]|uniref:Alpha/beta fold hydrolase n=1 Tax=Streptomyces marokkonensis TaxID=324855 RepID=A0ABW6Q952_9ACTN